MNRKWICVIFLMLVFIILLVGCQTNNTSDNLQKELEEKNKRIAELEKRIEELESQLDVSNETKESLLYITVEVINAIKTKDFNKLAGFVHPTKGLRFSPYDNIDIETSNVFTADEVKNLLKDDKVYMWGHYDGSGEPIELNFSDYYEKFIYDVDFANPQIIGNNVVVSYGNAIDNIKEIYPESYFIELHFKGLDPKYEGMDWRSLKLVFERENDTWYLVAIVHGQWTI